MIELAEQQRQELSKPGPVVIDPRTRKEYVLVRRKLYARTGAIFDEEGPDRRAAGVLADRAMREQSKGRRLGPRPRRRPIRTAAHHRPSHAY